MDGGRQSWGRPDKCCNSPADVGADPERTAAQRDERAFAAAGPTGGHVAVPRIGRPPEDVIVGFSPLTEKVSTCTIVQAEQLPLEFEGR